MDHEGNVGPWMHLAEDMGLNIKWLKFNLSTFEYDLNELSELLSEGNVRLAAINYASNCLGTVNDVKKITEMAHQSDTIVFVDAVQYVPHGPTDVQNLGCDFLVCSPYKFFGPHQGSFYGVNMNYYKNLSHIRCVPQIMPPGKFETGTQSHEGQAGTLGVIEYLEWLGESMGKEYPENFK